MSLLPNGYFPDDGSRYLFLSRPLADYDEDDLRRIIAWLGVNAKCPREAFEPDSGSFHPSQPISQYSRIKGTAKIRP